MNISRFRNSLIAAAVLASMLTAPAVYARDPSTSASQASALSAGSVVVASGAVIVGSLSAVALSGQAVVASVEAVGESTVVVLRGVSDGAEASIRVSGQAARGLSVAAGTVVLVTACSTGYVLTGSGQMIAFVPNDVGRSLVHSSPLQNAY